MPGHLTSVYFLSLCIFGLVDRWQVVTSSLNAEIGKSKGELMKEYTPPQKDDIKEAFKNNATYTLGKGRRL